MFKDNLKRIMNEKGFTVTSLYRATGIGKSSISQYLSGINIPSKKRIENISKVLDCTIEELMEENEKESIELNKKSYKVFNVPVPVAAGLMGKGIKFVYKGLQENRFPWGYGVKTSGKWNYFISSAKFTQETGIEVPETIMKKGC